MRRITAIIAVLLVLTPTAVAAASSSLPHWDAKPAGVEITCPSGELDQYQPRFVKYHLDIQPSSVYAWKASSPDRPTSVYVYFVYYANQDGLTSADSHVQDREPVYVFVSDDTGNVTKIIYDGYHYLAARNPSPQLENKTHPVLRIVEPWHNYVPAPNSTGQDVQLECLKGEFNTWLRNGWKKELGVGTTTNPWSMEHRGSWWRRDTLGGQLGRIEARISLLLNDVKSPLDSNTDLIPFI